MRAIIPRGRHRRAFIRTLKGAVFGDDLINEQLYHADNNEGLRARVREKELALLARPASIFEVGFIDE